MTVSKRFTITLTACLLCATALLITGPILHASNAPKGFSPLFNGKDLAGWWGLGTVSPKKWREQSKEKLDAQIKASLPDIHKHWTAKDGILINDGKGKYLTTLKNYGDFELLVDYKTVAKADSGIYLRGVPQVQIWDYTKAGGKWKIGADKGSGGLWNNNKGSKGKDPLVLADKPFGQWNHFRIILAGDITTIYLNDKLVVDHAVMHNYFDRKGGMPKDGPIQLQTHGGEIQWKNIFIREIGAEESAAIQKKAVATNSKLEGKARAITQVARKPSQKVPHFIKQVGGAGPDAGFVTIFNGKDFTGWTGSVKGYQVVDGTIGCKKGSGGVLFTKEVYANFVVRFEFKLPPGGNNGLALRYPGKGDTAYVGMCELQVLDNTAKKYAKLKPQQYHGSIYGMVAAKRGYLKKVGEWNKQEVTVNGSRITVVLNGTTITDADLAKVDPKTFMRNEAAFKGRTRTEGHFGFAGHGDAVLFRNIKIKTLK
jgi:hypothetical protein